MSEELSKEELAIIELRAKIGLLNVEIEARKKEWLAENCPLTIGHQVTVCGYSYEGMQGVVDTIFAKEGWNRGTLTWAVSGRVIRADGSIGEREFSFRKDQYDTWVRKNAPL